MNPEQARKIVGVVSSLFGVIWICNVTYPAINGLWANDGDSASFPFLFFVVPLMVTPGALAVIFGVRFFKTFSETSTRWMLGVFAFLCTFWLSFALSTVFSEFLAEDVAESLFSLVSGLVVIPVYLLTVQWVIRYFTGTERRLVSLLARWVILLMSFQIWLLLTSVFDVYSPIEEGYRHLHKQPWESLGVLVPLIVAWGTFCALDAKLKKARQASSEAPVSDTEPV